MLFAQCCDTVQHWFGVALYMTCKLLKKKKKVDLNKSLNYKCTQMESRHFCLICPVEAVNVLS